jgi:Protein of unknown function (DUF2852)
MAGTAEANGWNGRGWNRSDWSGPGRGGPGYGGPGWGPPVHHWHPLGILIVILGFMVWWPLGLALLFAKLWRTSMGCSHGGHGRWEHKIERMQRKMDWFRSRMEGSGFEGRRYSQPSGNRAFDEYKTETLKRLEDEQQEFKGFLERLRHAKDKAEFDQFMADRKSRPSSPPEQPQQG